MIRIILFFCTLLLTGGAITAQTKLKPKKIENPRNDVDSLQVILSDTSETNPKRGQPRWVTLDSLKKLLNVKADQTLSFSSNGNLTISGGNTVDIDSVDNFTATGDVRLGDLITDRTTLTGGLLVEEGDNSAAGTIAHWTLATDIGLPSGEDGILKIILNESGSQRIIDPFSTQTIDGSATITIEDGDAVAIYYDVTDTNWRIFSSDIASTGGGSDGVATAGAFDSGNSEIDITVTGASDFSIDVAGMLIDNDSTNEIQVIDTSELVGTILKLSLSKDNEPAKEIDLASIDTDGYVSNVGLSFTDLNFTGVGSAFNSSVSLQNISSFSTMYRSAVNSYTIQANPVYLKNLTSLQQKIDVDGVKFPNATVNNSADTLLALGTNGEVRKLTDLTGFTGVGGLSGGASDKVAIWSDATTLTNNSNFHWDDTNERLGLGETVPDAQIHVKHTGGEKAGIIMQATSVSNYTGFSFQNNSSSLGAQFLYTNPSFTSGIFEGDQCALVNYNTSGKITLIAGGTSGVITFATGGLGSADEQMRIDDSGNVGIGVTSITHPLEMGSGAHVTSGGVWTDASSRTLKENISELSYEEALEALINLKPQTYNYINSPDESYVGFIAEDVPELVAHNDRKSLSSMEFAAVSIAVIKQQQQVIESLIERVEALENK